MKALTPASITAPKKRTRLPRPPDRCRGSCRWLRDRDLQRETESALNVVENYNGVNDYIRFGKRGELASNRREEQELGMLC